MNSGYTSGSSFDQPLSLPTMLLDGYYFHHTNRETGAQRGSQAAQSNPAREGLGGDLNLQSSHPTVARKGAGAALARVQGQLSGQWVQGRGCAPLPETLSELSDQQGW